MRRRKRSKEEGERRGECASVTSGGCYGDDALRAGARVQLADVTTSAAGRRPWPSLRLTDGPSPLPHQVLLGQMEDLAETQLTAIELPEFQV